MRRKPPKRPPLDEALRQAVLARDNHTCQAAVRGFPHPCFGKLHVHHIVLRSHQGADEAENLISVCASAHDYLHNVDRAGAEQYGLIRRR